MRAFPLALSTLLIAGCVSAAAAPADRAPYIWRGRASAALTSPVIESRPFDRAVVSWNASGPVFLELEAGGRWHAIGRWGPEPRSVPGGAVNVDTLRLPAPARSFRFRVTPEPGTTVTLVAVTRWLDSQTLSDHGGRSSAWGRTLDVPQRSQSSETVHASRVCSPTSLGMVLEHHGVRKTTREIALGVHDREADLYGNWPFNTAYAHSVSGLEAYVARAGFEEVEEEIAAGRPVIISHNWTAGQLNGAPIRASAGHIIVVVGFTPQGDVIVNDPAGRPGGVRRTYRRSELATTWLRNGRGIAYFLKPAL